MTAALPSWISLLPILLLWATVLCGGCRADTRGLQTLTLGQFAALHESGADLRVFDANDADTRDEYGVIPGATLLTSYRDYDAATELPADRAQQVVFYCYSSMCGAAAEAARKAVGEGWRNVWLMPDGLRGWKQAGLPVDRPVVSSAR